MSPLWADPPTGGSFFLLGISYVNNARPNEARPCLIESNRISNFYWLVDGFTFCKPLVFGTDLIACYCSITLLHISSNTIIIGIFVYICMVYILLHYYYLPPVICTREPFSYSQELREERKVLKPHLVLFCCGAVEFYLLFFGCLGL